MEADARRLVVEVVSEHAESLLRTARRYAGCGADAEDAYQRALEIFVKNAHRLDAEGAHRWLHVVVRNEALAVRRSRSRLVGVEEESALDALDDARHVASVEERSERFDDLSRAAEALQRLKPQEVTALWLKAEGLSYEEIARRQGWTYTKVNRCITEGRRSFLRRYAGIEAGEECERWSSVVSAIADGEATPQQLLDARPHLRNCPSCRASLAAMRNAGRAVAGLLPPAGVLVGAAGEAEAAGGAVARLGELAASLHERAAGLAMKAQAAADAVVSGKAAAVAASAAALAGGGVAAERHLGGEPARAESSAPAAVASGAAAAAERAASRAGAPGSGAAPESLEPSGRERHAPGGGGDDDLPAAASRDDEPAPEATFAPEAAPAAPAPAPARPPDAPPSAASDASAARPGGEFGLVPERP